MADALNKWLQLQRQNVPDGSMVRWFGHCQAIDYSLNRWAALTRYLDDGDLPAGSARQVTVIADVVAVNAKTQTLTLRGPKRTVDLRLRDPKQVKLVKVGDQVEATYTEALAVSVEPAPKPAAKK